MLVTVLSRLWPVARHTRLATIIAFVGVFIALMQVGQWPATNTGNNTNATLVIIIATAAAIDVLYTLCRHLDRSYPQAGGGQAALRLFVPVVVLAAIAAWIMNKGLFADSDFAFVPVLVASAIGAVTIRMILPSPAERRATEVTDEHAAPPLAGKAAHGVVLDGPLSWPTEPPTVAITTPSVALPPEPPRSSVGRAKSKVHRVTSGIISVGWLPLGLLVWVAANWCPDDGAGDAVMVTSTIYVFVQVLVNPIAGYVLDRRYGNSGGTLLSVGRSIIAAAVLMGTVGYFLSLFVPDGPSNYCG